MRKAGKIVSRAIAVMGVKRNKALLSLQGCLFPMETDLTLCPV